MRKSLTFALVAISVLIAFSAALTSSVATADNRLGVRAGDWIEYSVSYYSTSPSFPESEYTSGSYTKVSVEVIGVVGTNVTLHITHFYPDNSKSSVIRSGDISENLCDYLIIAGLEAGDPVCPEGDFFGTELTVRETVNMTILGTQRYVNIVEACIALDAQVILYFDKAAGILVESHRSSLLFGWMVERITSSSVSFSVGSVWLQLGVGFAASAMVAVIIIAFVIADRRQRAQNPDAGGEYLMYSHFSA